MLPGFNVFAFPMMAFTCYWAAVAQAASLWMPLDLSYDAERGRLEVAWQAQDAEFLMGCIGRRMGNPRRWSEWEAALDAATDTLLARGVGAGILDWKPDRPSRDDQA